MKLTIVILIIKINSCIQFWFGGFGLKFYLIKDKNETDAL